MSSLGIIGFAFIGLTDGTVTARNIGLWLVIVVVLCAVMWQPVAQISPACRACQGHRILTCRLFRIGRTVDTLYDPDGF